MAITNERTYERKNGLQKMPYQEKNKGRWFDYINSKKCWRWSKTARIKMLTNELMKIVNKTERKSGKIVI
jgi:hypothetical protein